MQPANLNSTNFIDYSEASNGTVVASNAQASLAWTDDVLEDLKNHQQKIEQLFDVISLSFEQLPGCHNAPVHVFHGRGNNRKSLGVFKREKSFSFVEYQMHALAEIKVGFGHLPKIVRNRAGQYVTKLGENFYTIIEYLKPDPNHEERVQNFSFNEMVSLVKEFHNYSERSSYAHQLAKSSLDRCLSDADYFSDHELISWLSTFCSSNEWERVKELHNYFVSASFREIYNSMPKTVLHGDFHLANIIFSQGKPFLIDFEAMRYDVRLWDFAPLCCGRAFVKHYLTLLKTKELFPLIEAHYNPLTTVEKEHFHDIILLRKMYLIGRYLHISKEALIRKDIARLDCLRSKIAAKISEITGLLIVETV